MVTVGRKKAHLKVTVGATDISLMVADGGKAYQRTQQEPLNPIINTSGELDYAAVNPKVGITWDISDLSRGLGRFEFAPGYYFMGTSVDTRYRGVVMPGPRPIADLTGIAANEKVVRHIRIGADNWVITTTTAYRSASGTGNWTELGANGAGWVAGNPTDIIAYQVSGGNPVVAVAMGSAAAYQYTVDNGTTWVTSTKAENAKYANYFTLGHDAVTGNTKIWYVRNPNELYSTFDLTNNHPGITPTFIGDYVNDEFNSVLEFHGVVLCGKRRYLYDGFGTIVAGPYRSYATSNDGTLTGYPTHSANANFENPTILEGRIYYPVEDVRIIEYDGQSITEGVEPSAWGAAPNLHLPINGMCAVGSELWVAIGSETPNLLIDAMLPGRFNLIGNVYSTGASRIFAGRRQPDGSWQWHGSLIATDSGNRCRLLWYDDTTSMLYFPSGAQELINTSQRRAFVALKHPLALANGSTVISLFTGSWEVETSIYYQNQPNVTKTLRYASAKARVAASGTLALLYRTATEETAVAYTGLVSWSTQALAETGTAFPASTTFKGVRVLFRGTGGADDDYTLMYNAQIIHRFYPNRYDAITCRVESSGSYVNAAGALGSPAGATALRTALQAWMDATDPATVEDLETGDTWAMDLESFGEQGVGREKVFELHGYEVR